MHAPARSGTHPLDDGTIVTPKKVTLCVKPVYTPKQALSLHILATYCRADDLTLPFSLLSTGISPEPWANCRCFPPLVISFVVSAYVLVPWIWVRAEILALKYGCLVSWKIARARFGAEGVVNVMDDQDIWTQMVQ